MEGFPGASDGKESTCNAGNLGSIPGEGSGNPLQYSCLENPEEPNRLQSMGSQKVRHVWVTKHACVHYFFGVIMELYIIFFSKPLSLVIHTKTIMDEVMGWMVATQRYAHWKPGSVTLFGERLFVDIIRKSQDDSFLITMGSKSNNKCAHKRRGGDTQR